MLAECVESVAQLTPVKGWKVEHLWLTDENYDGCSKTTNTLARMAKGEWLVPIADDDFVLPWFLTDHVALSGDADVVYAPPIVTGPNHGGEEQFWGQPPNIPSVCLIRKDLWERCGGYDEGFAQTEDLVLFNRALNHDARFARSDRQSWVYRFGHGNKSRGHVFGGN